MNGELPQVEQIWQNVLQSDMSALERIYKHYYPSLFQYAQKLTADSDMAEDAVQDTILYLWNHRDQIGTINSFRFYLFKSLRNTCFKLIQKRKRLASLEEAGNHIELVILPKELHLSNQKSQIKKQIEIALADLSVRQREIILLKFFHNLDYEEIGEVLAINYQSVVNHVYRAIQKLRKSEVLQFFEKNK